MNPVSLDICRCMKLVVNIYENSFKNVRESNII